jgi:hypothetical protein
VLPVRRLPTITAIFFCFIAFFTNYLANKLTGETASRRCNHESWKWFSLGARASRPQEFADTENFPKQESVRRFRGIVVESAVLEHDGGRGRPRSQCASIFGIDNLNSYIGNVCLQMIIIYLLQSAL